MIKPSDCVGPAKSCFCGIGLTLPFVLSLFVTLQVSGLHSLALLGIPTYQISSRIDCESIYDQYLTILFLVPQRKV